MLKKVSLSVMVFTYLFAGVAHFLETDYFAKFMPSFIPNARFFALLPGIAQLLLGILLAITKTRRGACYGILVLWSLLLPINIYTVVNGGTGTPFTSLQLALLIPFHLLLMLWAFWHSQPSGAGRRKRA